MLRQSLNESSLYRALKEREKPAPPKDLLARLSSAQVKTTHPLAWVATAAIALMIVIPFLIRPTYSWADVINAVSEQSQYSIANTRLMNGGSERVKAYTIYRDGELWRSGETFGLEDRTVTVRHYPPSVNYVLLDSRRDPPAVSFRVQDILRMGAKPTVQRNVEWHGRTVDVFHLIDTYRAGKVETFDQQVVVDQKSHLPIQVTVMRDSGHWGDIWDYDFSRPDPSVFVPKIDKGAKIYNLAQERKDLAAALTKNPDALFITDDERMPMMLVHGKPDKFFTEKIYLNLQGHKETFRGATRPVHLHGKSMPWTMTLHLGGYDWQMVTLYATFRGFSVLRLNDDQRQVSGSVTIGNRKVEFKNAQILHTGSTEAFINSFGEELVATPDR